MALEDATVEPEHIVVVSVAIHTCPIYVHIVYGIREVPRVAGELRCVSIGLQPISGCIAEIFAEVSTSTLPPDLITYPVPTTVWLHDCLAHCCAFRRHRALAWLQCSRPRRASPVLSRRDPSPARQLRKRRTTRYYEVAELSKEPEDRHHQRWPTDLR